MSALGLRLSGGASEAASVTASAAAAEVDIHRCLMAFLCPEPPGPARRQRCGLSHDILEVVSHHDQLLAFKNTSSIPDPVSTVVEG